jgi:hypothetical protein
MLDIIEDHDDEEGYLLGNDDKKQGLAPVDDQCDDYEDAKGQVLDDGQPPFTSFIAIQALEMVHYGALLKIAADGRIGQQGKDIIGFAEAVGDGEVAFPIVKLMVILVVRGGPGEGREAVEQRDPVVGEMVEEGGLPHGHVVVIVGDNGYSDGQVKGQNEQGPVKTDAPLNKKKGRGQGKIDQGFNIG